MNLIQMILLISGSIYMTLSYIAYINGDTFFTVLAFILGSCLIEGIFEMKSVGQSSNSYS